MQQGRLVIAPLKQPLKLEEANEIPISVHGFEVYSANVSWSYYAANRDLWPTDADMDVTVMYHTDGSAYITIIPEKLGKIRLALSACFADGGAAVDWADAEVILPERKPEKLYVLTPQCFSVGRCGTLYMGLAKGSKRAGLLPTIVYQGALHPAPIPAELVTFQVISATEDDPPISIDKSTGKVTPLRVGHALVQTSFEGLSTLTCVEVMVDSSDGSDRTVCRELVPEGMAPPTSGFDPNFSAPKVKVRKQP